MKFKVDGQELSAEGMRVHELCEAEKALQMNMGDGTGAAIAIQLYVSMRRLDKDKPIHLLADEVMKADITTFEEVEEGSPPAEAANAAANGKTEAGPESLLTSGPRRSVPSA